MGDPKVLVESFLEPLQTFIARDHEQRTGTRLGPVHTHGLPATAGERSGGGEQGGSNDRDRSSGGEDGSSSSSEPSSPPTGGFFMGPPDGPVDLALVRCLREIAAAVLLFG